MPSAVFFFFSFSFLYFSIRWSLALEGNVLSPDAEILFNLYMCIYRQTFAYYRLFRQKMVISFFMTFRDVVIFLSSFCIYLLPSLIRAFPLSFSRLDHLYPVISLSIDLPPHALKMILYFFLKIHSFCVYSRIYTRI